MKGRKIMQRFCDREGIALGISAHWGLYSLYGRGEWVMAQENIPVSEYEKSIKKFNPVRFDADEWIKLVKDSGASAFMITTKHHDGFCLFDTEFSRYNIMHTPFGKDPIAALAEAASRHKIGLHFYYSLLDWHHPAYRNCWPEYISYYQGQIQELCTKYGSVGGFIFDGFWPRNEFPPEYDYFRPGGDFCLKQTYEMIHSLQPGCLIVNNHHVLPLDGEDYQIWELDYPGENTIGFNTTEIGSLPTATWFNINKGWSYNSTVRDVKPTEQLFQFISESYRRGASICWLNVGPSPSGEIIKEEADALCGLGEFIRKQHFNVCGF
jgi:alpha-L-fucosidase